MNHINEDMLIQYAFDLLEIPQRQETAGHLEHCEDCRANLERIQKQFAVLDVLDTDAALSEGLIQKALAQKSVIAKTIPFYRKVWVEWTAAAAAVALICALLLQHLPIKSMTKTMRDLQSCLNRNPKKCSIVPLQNTREPEAKLMSDNYRSSKNENDYLFHLNRRIIQYSERLFCRG